jgi:hypothetical protein
MNVLRKLYTIVLKMEIKNSTTTTIQTSVTDPDSGWKKNPDPGSRINISGTYFRELSNNNFWVKKYFNSLSIQCSESGIRCHTIILEAKLGHLPLKEKGPFCTDIQ